MRTKRCNTLSAGFQHFNQLTARVFALVFSELNQHLFPRQSAVNKQGFLV
ncbi:Uncharacterised protein [Vibrio cholerae]|nr:Uncharacterised protein [Vibrio cholerae]CSB65390.1 Uncharacterised protein [Vibrio cholerae]CSI36397.1 Uncharacterised protein [Vibrio cholerae]CSI53060.1 Uncharacterised protein [Vibrio cholerae]